MKVDLPALNWFVHVLVNNVGGNDWVTMTPDEQAEYQKKTGSDYQYKVITHPIPDGKDIILENGKYKIECSEQHVKDLIIALAQSFQTLSADYHNLLKEKLQEVWHPATEAPDGPHSSCRCRSVLVFSPVLLYIVSNGICQGHHDYRNNQWYIDVNGKSISHRITHWRHLPPSVSGTTNYEDIKEEVETLKRIINI